MKPELSVEYAEKLSEEYLVPFGIRILVALLVFYIGKAVAKGIVKTVSKLTKDRLDDLLRKFLCSVPTPSRRHHRRS